MDPGDSPGAMLFWAVVASVIFGSIGLVLLIQWALNLIPDDRFVGLPLPIFVGLVVAAVVLGALTLWRQCDRALIPDALGTFGDASLVHPPRPRVREKTRRRIVAT
jgi:hypothetical protein